MRSRRAVPLLLLLLAVLVWWTWPDPAPTPSPAPAKTRTVRLPRPAAPPSEVPALVPDVPPAAFVPEGPEQEALAALATAMGAGFIRCTVPTDPGDLSVPFTRATWEGRTLVVLVEESDGIAQIRGAPPERPADLAAGVEAFEAWMTSILEASRTRFTVTWGEAWPGEVGWCDVDEPGRVRLAGRVTLPDGSVPVEAVWVNGCDAGGSVYADVAGGFSFETDAGPPCTLEVKSMGMPGGTVVDRSTDRDDILVVWKERDSAMVEVLEEKARNARDRAAYERDVLRAALDEVAPGAGRETMRGWQEQRAAELDAEADMLSDMVERWETEMAEE